MHTVKREDAIPISDGCLKAMEAIAEINDLMFDILYERAWEEIKQNDAWIFETKEGHDGNTS